MHSHYWLLLPSLLLMACRPDLGLPISAVTTTRIAAVKFEPPDVPPGANATATAFVVAPSGVLMPAVDWSLCLTPKSTTNNDVVDPSCLQPDGTQDVATSVTAQALTVPMDACRLFGPDTPPEMPGQPPVQARAPDVTGGYYQPVRGELANHDAPAIGLLRVRCSLADASAMLETQFAADYMPNTNPTLTPLSASLDGQTIALDHVPAGKTITLTAGWTASSPESFPVLDPAAQVLVTQREAMTISWLATAGTIGTADTGRGESDPALTTSTRWTAPATPGAAHLFMVLHDSRGGIDFASVDASVVNE